MGARGGLGERSILPQHVSSAPARIPAPFLGLLQLHPSTAHPAQTAGEWNVAEYNKSLLPCLCFTQHILLAHRAQTFGNALQPCVRTKGLMD